MAERKKQGTSEWKSRIDTATMLGSADQGGAKDGDPRGALQLRLGVRKKNTADDREGDGKAGFLNSRTLKVWGSGTRGKRGGVSGRMGLEGGIVGS